jgi:hypothetical protein
VPLYSALHCACVGPFAPVAPQLVNVHRWTTLASGAPASAGPASNVEASTPASTGQAAPQVAVRCTPQLSLAVTCPQVRPSRQQNAQSLSLGQPQTFETPPPPHVS